MARAKDLSLGGAMTDLRVLWLCSQFPHANRPNQVAFAVQTHDELAKLCKLGTVAPVRWVEMLGRAENSTRGCWRPADAKRPIYLYPPRVMHAAHGRFLYWSAWPAVKNLAKRLKPNVVLASFAYPDGYAGMLAARRLGLPVVVMVWGSDLLVLCNCRQRRALVAETMRKADGVLAVSRQLAQKAVDLGADQAKVVHVPNGVDRSRFRPMDQQAARRQLGLENVRGRLLLFVGNLAPIKGLDALWQAMPNLPDAALLMVGAGPMRKGLEARARAAGFADRLIWAGSQPHERVPLFMSASDALVLPSLSEGEPNVVLEALGCGRPVVASRVGGVPEMISPGRNGYLCQPGDARTLGDAIRQVLSRSWSPADIAATTADRSWSATALRYRQVLEAVASRAPIPMAPEPWTKANEICAGTA